MSTFTTLQAVLDEALTALEARKRPPPSAAFVTLNPVDDHLGEKSAGQLTVSSTGTEPTEGSEDLPCINAVTASVQVTLRRRVAVVDGQGRPPTIETQQSQAEELLADFDALRSLPGATGFHTIDPPAGGVAGVTVDIERLIT
ncbi:MAG: hypothetical protein AAGA99_26380 [Actinomycetota bacterium]